VIISASVNDTYTATRAVVVGHCPECGIVLAVFNDGRSWPPVECPCGWGGGTGGLVNHHRLDRGWLVSDEHGPQRELRT
jgi:hypothetical protein